MVNALLTAAVRLPLDAVRVFDPIRLMLRLSNVATPDVVFLVTVPLRVPVPVVRATVTGVPDVVTSFP